MPTTSFKRPRTHRLIPVLIDTREGQRIQRRIALALKRKRSEPSQSETSHDKRR